MFFSEFRDLYALPVMLRWEKKGKESKEGTKGDGEIDSARRVTAAYCSSTVYLPVAYLPP